MLQGVYQGGCIGRRYVLFRLLVNMYVFVINILVCFATRSSPYSSSQRIFGYLGNHAATLIFPGPLNTLEPMMLLFPSLLGGVKELFV